MIHHWVMRLRMMMHLIMNFVRIRKWKMMGSMKISPYHIRRRTNFSSRCALIRPSSRLCSNCLIRKWTAIADPITVSEMTILPFFLKSITNIRC